MTVAYHLRPCKFVDRSLFVQTLRDELESPTSATYIGLGGPFMDDFRLLYRCFEFHRMISIDENELTTQRQEFNRPSKKIDLVTSTSTEFIYDTDFTTLSRPLVVWLDYTNPKQYFEQLNDLRDLLVELQRNDIFRVTFNVDKRTLKSEGKSLTFRDKIKKRRSVLRSRLGEHWPSSGISDAELKSGDISDFLLRVVRSVSYNAMKGSDNSVHILNAYRYSDTSTMLTVTGKISLRGDTNVAPVGSVQHIRVPVLSTTERLCLEKELPSDDLNAIHRAMPFLDEKEIQAIATFFRHLPFFYRSMHAS